MVVKLLRSHIAAGKENEKMNKQEFLGHMQRIIYLESYQAYKGKAIKSCLREQATMVKNLVKALGLEPLTIDDFVMLFNYDCSDAFIRQALAKRKRQTRVSKHPRP